MANLRETRQKVLDMSEEERTAFAKQNAKKIAALFDLESEFFELIRMLTRAFVSADRKVGISEYNLYVKATGDEVSVDEFKGFTARGNESTFLKSLYKRVDELDSDTRYAAAMFGCCIMAHDGLLTVSEQELFKRILG